MKRWSHLILNLILLLAAGYWLAAGRSGAPLSVAEAAAPSRSNPVTAGVRMAQTATPAPLPGRAKIVIANNLSVKLAIDKWDLWATGGPHLRGANVYQRRTYPELEGTYNGPGPVGTPFTQEDFDRLAALGANYVNISHPGLFTEQPPYVLDEAMQENLDHLLWLIAQADMFAVISFRTGPGRSEFTFFYGDEGSWFDESYYNDAVWEEEAAQDAWVEMWRYTAKRYWRHPIVVGYDLMVEPNANHVRAGEWNPEKFYDAYGDTLYDWNPLALRISTAIREEDGNVPILIGGMGNSSVEWLPFVQPTGDRRTVYLAHQYTPHPYTHQDPDESGELRLTYPGEFDVDHDGQIKSFNRFWMAKLLRTVDQFAAQHDTPMAINEFGVKRWQPGAAAFMRYQMGLFEQRGWNYAIWAWASSWQEGLAYDAFNFTFGPDPDNHERTDSELLDVITGYWSRNKLRPSFVQFITD